MNRRDGVHLGPALRQLGPLTALGCSFVLGGVLGIGTLVTAFLTGPIVQVFLAPCRRLTNAVLAKVEGKTVDEMLSQDRAEREARA